MERRKNGLQIYLLLVAMLLGMVAAVLYIVHYNTGLIISDLTATQARTANRALSNHLAELEASALERAQLLAQSESITSALKSRDFSTLRRGLSGYGVTTDFTSFCDENGTILARIRSGRIGESIAGLKGVSDALQTRRPSIAIDELPDVGPSIYASVAITEGDTLLGVVTCGFILSSEERLDKFKEQNDCEATIVYRDMRVSSTIKDEEGERITGSGATSYILEAVSEPESFYSGRLELFGGTYQIHCSPLLSQEKVVGMLFTGVDIVPTLNQQQEMNSLVFFVAMIAIGVAGALLLILSRFTRVFSSTLEELSDKTASLYLLESMLNAMEIFVHVVDASTEAILFANDRYKEHFGLDDSILGKHCRDVFPEGRCESCPRGQLLANHDEPVIWDEYKPVTGRYYRTTARLIRWPDGRQVILHYRVDIHEEKQAQELLLRMSSIVESSPNFVSYTKLSGECLFVNDAASAMTGYSHEALMEDYVGLLFDEKTANYLRNEVPARVLEHGPLHYEIAGRNRDGTLRTYTASTFLIESKERAFGTIATDITERKRIEAERLDALTLAETRAHLLQSVSRAAAILLQSATENFRDDLLRCMALLAEAVGAERVHIWRNHEKDGTLYSTQLYEWPEPPTPLPGDLSTEGVPYGETVPEWMDLLLEGRCVNGPAHAMPPSVRERLAARGILSILVLPVSLRGGLWGFVCFDDCHRERVFSEDEEAILRSAGLLFANAYLRNETDLGMDAAVREAQAANRAKSEFLSRMSHEMRTPMNAILGSAAFALKSGGPPETGKYLKQLNLSAKHLLSIINDILDMSKIEAGRMELFAVTFPLRDLIDQAKALIGVKLEERQQSFSISVDKALPDAILADRQRLMQVITNLLSNASKFTPEGGAISLSVSLRERHGDDACTLLFEIADNGIGIPEEERERIFAAFEQADNTIARRHGGTGLGLSICRSLVGVMGGDIWVVPVPEGGSRFCFTVRAGLAAPGEPAGKEDGPEDLADLFAGKRILLADDVEINRELFLALVEDTGVAVDCAQDGKEACARYAASPDSFDLIFMDIHMPEMDGYEATRMIRSLPLPGAQDIPIVAMTADVFSQDIEKCLSAGMNGHVGKPLDPDAVLREMKRYLL